LKVLNKTVTLSLLNEKQLKLIKYTAKMALNRVYTSVKAADTTKLLFCLVFKGTFSTNRLYRAIEL